MLKREQGGREFVVLNMGTSVDAGQSVTQAQASAPQAATVAFSAWEPVIRTCAQATDSLREVVQGFWGAPVRLVFLSASTQTHYFWRMDDFHVSQLMLGDEDVQDSSNTALLRLSDAACASLLNHALGARPAPHKAFSFTQLSPFEATVLNEFSRDVLGHLMKTVMKKPKSDLPGEVVHLIWAVQLEEAPSQEPVEVGKIVLSLPAGAIRIASSPPDEDITAVPDEFFFHVETEARIQLGSTRLALSDLDQLETDDVVVLENSQADRMFLIEPISGEALPFQAEIRQRSRISIPVTQEFAMMETQHLAQARQNLWDNLMIEVNAEFAPIRMPLKQLKQMSEGLVIEMGDLVHNQICLQVEGKTLAQGELIIVGDKFGIRISEVEAAKTQSSSDAGLSSLPVPTNAATDAAMAPASDEGLTPAGESGADEEANLDTFLNEDFDETFDDEEDW